MNTQVLAVAKTIALPFFGIKIAKEIYMPIIIIIVAMILNKVIQAIIKKTFNPIKKHRKFDSRKVSTIRSLLCNVTKYAIWIIAALSILGVFGVNTTAIITGLGVASAVIGLAFQDTLKDILAGVSILFENQFAVGDLVKIGNFQGNVISLGLKTTRVQAYTGEVKIISNRNITEVINYSMDKTLAVVDVSVAYEEKLDKVEKILQLTAATLREKIPLLTNDVELLGVQELADSAVVFRLVGKCKPAQHFEVERQMRKEFKNALDKNGIKIPYPQVEVHHEK